MQASKLELSGRSLIGFREGAGAGDVFYAVDPTTGLDLQPGFTSASADEIEAAARLAEDAVDRAAKKGGLVERRSDDGDLQNVLMKPQSFRLKSPIKKSPSRSPEGD